MTNIVIETGRLTADPELRYTGETPLCKFRIAVDRPKKKGADKPETADTRHREDGDTAL